MAIIVMAATLVLVPTISAVSDADASFFVKCKNTASGKTSDGPCPGKSAKSPNKHNCFSFFC